MQYAGDLPMANHVIPLSNCAQSYVGRLAPSPTGAQHLGNARTYIVAWLIARSRGGRLLLRIEDLDTPRTKAGADQQIFEDLQWLGIDWDPDETANGSASMDGALSDYVVQSLRGHRYRELLNQLQSRELVYPCTCSRTDIETASSAPHESHLDGTVYPGTCSQNQVADAAELERSGKKFAWRFRFSADELMQWEDDFCGHQSCFPYRELGDFIVARNYGPIAYQLAVVADDHDSGVNHVVRGNDLIYSTYRQIALYNAFNWTPPRWMHLPLVVGSDGRRLAKRHGDTRLSTYRSHGMSPETIVGAIAKSLGFVNDDCKICLQELHQLANSDPDWCKRVPKSSVTLHLEKD